MTDQRELGTRSTAGPDYFRLSSFKLLAISTYNVRALFQQGKLINYSWITGTREAHKRTTGTHARSARGTEPHTHRLWSTSFPLVVT